MPQISPASTPRVTVSVPVPEPVAKPAQTKAQTKAQPQPQAQPAQGQYPPPPWVRPPEPEFQPRQFVEAHSLIFPYSAPPRQQFRPQGPLPFARSGRPRRFDRDTEQAFHNAMMAEPTNDLHHLVYADYLEEQGKPVHAEMIRRAVNEHEPNTISGTHFHVQPQQVSQDGTVIPRWSDEYNPPGSTISHPGNHGNYLTIRPHEPNGHGSITYYVRHTGLGGSNIKSAIDEMHQRLEAEGANQHDPQPRRMARHQPSPGEELPDGSHYEPPAEPDLGEFIANRFKGDYGEGKRDDPLIAGTGFLLANGAPVDMGDQHARHEDHRAAIPTASAMQRWGWPEDVIRQYNESTRGPALRELMRRARAIRLHVDPDGDLMVDAQHWPLTGRQVSALVDHVITRRPRSVSVHLGDADPVELDGGDADALQQLLTEGPRTRRRLSRPRRLSRSTIRSLLENVSLDPYNQVRPQVLADALREEFGDSPVWDRLQRQANGGHENLWWDFIDNSAEPRDFDIAENRQDWGLTPLGPHHAFDLYHHAESLPHNSNGRHVITVVPSRAFRTEHPPIFRFELAPGDDVQSFQSALGQADPAAARRLGMSVARTGEGPPERMARSSRPVRYSARDLAAGIAVDKENRLAPLVLADWLDENGHTGAGEVVRRAMQHAEETDNYDLAPDVFGSHWITESNVQAAERHPHGLTTWAYGNRPAVGQSYRHPNLDYETTKIALGLLTGHPGGPYPPTDEKSGRHFVQFHTGPLPAEDAHRILVTMGEEGVPNAHHYRRQIEDAHPEIEPWRMARHDRPRRFAGGGYSPQDVVNTLRTHPDHGPILADYLEENDLHATPSTLHTLRSGNPAYAEVQNGKVYAQGMRTPNDYRRDPGTLAYLDAALWSSHDDEGPPLDLNHNLHSFSPWTLNEMASDWMHFYVTLPEHLRDAISGHHNQAATDFWLTRNGHGAGFWDGNWGEHGDELTDHVHRHFGEYDLYVGDDGQIHGHGYRRNPDDPIRRYTRPLTRQEKIRRLKGRHIKRAIASGDHPDRKTAVLAGIAAAVAAASD